MSVLLFHIRICCSVLHLFEKLLVGIQRLECSLIFPCGCSDNKNQFQTTIDPIQLLSDVNLNPEKSGEMIKTSPRNLPSFNH
jgi:hypothetical protein